MRTVLTLGLYGLVMAGIIVLALGVHLSNGWWIAWAAATIVGVALVTQEEKG